VARDLPSDHPEVLADRRFRSANRWPTGMPGFREAIVAYRETMEQLVCKLVRLYAWALRLPLEYFDRPFRGFQMKDAAQAEAWHKAGVANDGTSIEDPPGVRANGAYLAYLRDPDGNKLVGVARPAS
jgi:hypothetical protein